MSILVLALVVVAAAGSILTVAVVLALREMQRTLRETRRDRYFGRPLAERRAIKARVAARGRRLLPIFRLIRRIIQPKTMPSIEYEGVTGPRSVCTVEIYRAARQFIPDARDVFVATQMKCGTTWMQQVAYEVILRGKGDFSDDAHRHLYATSPWLEARQSVSLEDAPRLGDRGLRLIKTHLPTRLAPFSPEARYIYVARHPVACLASTADFSGKLAGPFVPAVPALVDWYCSDRFWWRSWPEHVAGWWAWSEEHPNVLFVHYEEMLADLPGVVDRVADHLGVVLTPEERHVVVEKSRFEAMKAREEVFEMAPPSLFSELDARSFLQSGSRSREQELGEADRRRILAFCRERLAGSRYPVERFYPDVAGPKPGIAAP